MMKNKLFVSLLCSLTLGLALVACQPEVETFESSEKIANATLIGTDSVRSGAIVSGTTMKVVEYKFLSENKAVRTVSTFGDGLYEAPVSMNLSYEMEYAKDYVGLNITFTPENAENEPFVVYFNENVIVENGTDTLPDVMAKLANLEKVMADLPNTTWSYEDSKLWIDTTKLDSVKVTITSSRIPDPVTGRPTIVKDTVYDTVQYELYDTIGTMMYTKVEFTVNRDDKTLANTGHYYYEYSMYDRGAVKIDSLSTLKDFDARWGLYSLTTARRFGVRMVSEDKKQQEDLAISLYDLKGGTLKVGGTTEFKLKK